MSVAFSLWSLELKAGEDYAQEITPPADVKITNVALGAELADEKGRTSVKLVYIAFGDSDDEEDDDEDEDEEESVPTPTETVICTLIPGQVEQVNLNIVIPKGRPVVFASSGKNTVHITGNYVDQMLPDEPPSDDELVDDAEIYEEDDEILEEEEPAVEEPKEVSKKQSKKRAREPEDDEKVAEKPSKKESKKQNKKQKAEDGTAVPVVEEKEKKPEKAEKKAKKGSKEEDNQGKAEEQTLAGGVKIVDRKIGKGEKAKKGDVVSMRYVGKLTNGNVFDSNTKGRGFQFELGAGDVIKGWDVGIVGMQPGGERLLTIPPAMGYGKRAQSDIPASSTLIFEVKLLSIKS